MKNHTTKTLLAWLLGFMVVAGDESRHVAIFANETAISSELRSLGEVALSEHSMHSFFVRKSGASSFSFSLYTTH